MKATKKNDTAKLIYTKCFKKYLPSQLKGAKRVAAFVGTLFSVAILIMVLLALITEAKVTVGILLLFAPPEAFAGFCADVCLNWLI